MMIKNKKAFELVGETAGNAIIAVLCLIVLFFLGFTLYNMFMNNNAKLEQAKASLDNIIEQINNLKNEGDTAIVTIYNPKNWMISYQQDTTVVGALPSSCNQRRCLCICESATSKEELFNNCNDPKKGVCKILDDKYIAIEGGFFGQEQSYAIEINPTVDLRLRLEGGIVRADKV